MLYTIQMLALNCVVFEFCAQIITFQVNAISATVFMRVPCRYNAAQIRARNSIERLFGVMKSRFPCLSSTMRLHINTTQAVIVACVILHNIAIDLKDPEFAAVRAGRRARVRNLPPLPDAQVGVAYRDSIVQTHFT